MLNLKKTAVAVLAFGSSAVFAGTMGPVCAPGNVTVPCEATAWDFGVQALYLQTSFNGDGGSHGDRFSTTGLTNYDNLQDQNNNWGWGFQLEGSYHFGTGNDANLNWYHFDDSHGNNNRNNQVGTAYVEGLELDVNNFRPHWDAVNLEFGQHVDFSQATKIRFHAGAQYARIKTSGRTAFLFRANLQDTLQIDSWQQTSSFNGFGPRIGSDLSYEVGNGFAFYGKAAATLLAGSIKYSTYNNTFNNNRSRTEVIPELEGKLGARYTYAMSSGDLTLDVGYLWIDYISARGTLVNEGSLGTITGINQDQRDDFGLNGVYAGLKWVGNVA